MTENMAWQRIPGALSYEIYPFERKPDIKSCNTYLIRSADWIVIADPGADDAQVQSIANVLNLILEQEKKPVLILLTHCHFDHFKSAKLLIDSLRTPCYLSVQEQGATAIEEGDEKQTLSYLYNQPWSAPAVDLRLLTDADKAGKEIRTADVHENHRFQIHTECQPISEGKEVFCQKLFLADNDPILLYHTPGHSPDSICIQAGAFLFTGDLLLAANPGVAGIPGWNQQDLVDSLETVHALITHNQIEFCVMGHGKQLPASKTGKIIEKNIQFAKGLNELVLLDRDRARFLGQYATDLLNEISELFSIVSGRLLSISYYLEKLSEEEEARKILERFDMDAVDLFLSEFNQFVKNHTGTGRIEMEVPLKAFQIIMKIQRSFDEQQLRELIDISLLRRIRWLMLDYIHIMQGYREEILGTSENINSLFLDYLTGLQQSTVSDRDFLESAYDEQTFIQELIRRIAHKNIFQDVEFRFSTTPGIPEAYVERERFCDMMTALFEPLITAGAQYISVNLNAHDDKIAIEILPEPVMKYHEYLERKIPFAQRIFQMFGGAVTLDSTNERFRLIVELLQAGGCFLIR